MSPTTPSPPLPIAWQLGNWSLVICGLFYALLCVFSVVTGAMYLLGLRELNPLELSDKTVHSLQGQGKLQRFARIMGAVTIVVGIAQGVSAWAILTIAGTMGYAIALGFTLFSLCSVLFKLRSKVSAFPLLKLGAYLAILIILAMDGNRQLFMQSGTALSTGLGTALLSTFTVVITITVGLVAEQLATRVIRRAFSESASMT